jgi:hypothetical protein
LQKKIIISHHQDIGIASPPGTEGKVLQLVVIIMMVVCGKRTIPILTAL